MTPMLLLMIMILMHIIEDFHVQGIMADMKQRRWWQNQTSDVKYWYDWKPAILLHGFEWAVFVGLPIIIVNGWTVPDWFCILLVLNGLIHSYIDHLKANKRSINLMADQTLHLIQIIAIWSAYVMLI